MKARKSKSTGKSPGPPAGALLLHQLAAARSRNLCAARALCAEVRKPVALADGSAALACPRCGDREMWRTGAGDGEAGVIGQEAARSV
jgi:predicted RNA-binding Zn-ribbon protein involved in translation (DUF1610 family)